MVQLNIVLPDSTFKLLTGNAQSRGVDPAQYCSVLLTETLQTEAPGVTSTPHERVSERDLMREILGYLKARGGKAFKVDVEQAVFEKFKGVFETAFYLESVGWGVPRWKKNLQFARHRAKNMGLLKPPEESGRGIWELTQKGQEWDFD